MAITISASNFGPIASGKVVLGPLTVFIGPNNAGKSFMAMLAYTALHGTLGATRPPFATPFYARRTIYPLGTLPQDLTENIADFVGEVMESQQINLRKAPSSLLQFMERALHEELQAYAGGLANEIERCFGSKLKDIARFGRDIEDVTITVEHSSPRWKVALSLERGKPNTSVVFSPRIRNIVLKFSVPPRSRGLNPEFLFSEILWRLKIEIFKDFPRQTFYLPAARSGILQSHKALASFVVSRSSLAGIEQMDIPKMSGVIADFISALLTIEHNDRTPLDKIAKFLESHLLSGQIRIRGTKLPYPEIYYESSAARFPLHRTSSMVSELAPVVLFLRYLVNRNASLIIEEPESHLHPQSQRKFARAIAKLVNAGVSVVLTTHSDYFLTQLNNEMLLSRLNEDERKSAGYQEDDCLDPSGVQAYLFQARNNDIGTIVKRIQVSPDEGISEAEFGYVAEELYSETVLLQRDGITVGT